MRPLHALLIAIAAHEDGSYTLHAGRLAGLGAGAAIGVYGPIPRASRRLVPKPMSGPVAAS
ncbi:MAG: hypothetical protein U1A78_20995 [Polyangia bacterium]